jgi:putative membrane protein
MRNLLIAWLVMTVSLLIISHLPLGIAIESFGKALLLAAVFGILNLFSFRSFRY